jgi:1,5-anhydro-D-fructose reductase (1,5-anhydro-D-mannitol-forming)
VPRGKDVTEVIGWGLVGASNIARQRVAGAIADSDRGELVAVMSHRLELAKTFAAEFAIPESVDSLQRLLQHPRVSAVYISSRNQYHHAQVLAAAAAGKHVLCEKPLATTLRDAVEMVSACSAAGVVFGTNHHLRNATTIRAMREMVASGRIGAPVSALVSQPVHVAESEWRRCDLAAGSGVSFDVLVHGADAIRYILEQEPVEVCAMGRSSASMAGGVNDSIMATYRFDGGALASLYADFNVAQGRTRVEIHGSEGSIFGSDVLGKTPHTRGRVSLRLGDRDEEIAIESQESRYLLGINRFNAAILGHGAPACSGLDGLRSLAMILAAEVAAASGKTEPVSGAGLE